MTQLELPFNRCVRRYLPRRLKAKIMLRQNGRCADCGTRLILGFFVFDHRPPLALRAAAEDPNDPDRLAAICWTCDQQKTPRDLKDIAKSKRIAAKEEDHRQRLRDKVPGRRAPSRSQWRKLQKVLGESLPSPEPPPMARSDGKDRGP